MLLAWVACLAYSAQQADDALKDDDTITSPKRDESDDPDAFDLLDAKPAGVIKPRNYTPPGEKPAALPPEGSKVVDRLCKITTDPSGWVLVQFPAEGKRKAIRPRWALPNETLEALETLHAKSPELIFRISGEMTVYQKNSFILIRRVSIVEPAEHEPEPQPVVVPVKTETQPATQPKATSQPAEPPSSADLMKTLLAERSAKPVILPRIKKKIQADKVTSVAPGAKGSVIEPATARLIVDRLMSVRPTGVAKWREATFQADNTLREPPVILLPCHLLTYAEMQPKSRRLRITGEITKYKGKRYMLLRKVIIERDMNRL